MHRNGWGAQILGMQMEQTMVYRLAEKAKKHWRRLNKSEFVILVFMVLNLLMMSCNRWDKGSPEGDAQQLLIHNI